MNKLESGYTYKTYHILLVAGHRVVVVQEPQVVEILMGKLEQHGFDPEKRQDLKFGQYL